jgi:hypothetical protein
MIVSLKPGLMMRHSKFSGFIPARMYPSTMYTVFAGTFGSRYVAVTAAHRHTIVAGRSAGGSERKKRGGMRSAVWLRYQHWLMSYMGVDTSLAYGCMRTRCHSYNHHRSCLLLQTLVHIMSLVRAAARSMRG